MSVNIVILPVVILLLLVIPTLLLSLLQLFLCRKELTWGRVLPIFSIIVSVLAALFVLFFALQVTSWEAFLVVALMALAALVILNIPTLIYYLIYRSEKKKRLQTDVNRTRIDDLE